MTTFEVSYMVDPGDGIVSKDTVTSEHDDMVLVLADWMGENDFFVVKCEIVDHSLMVKA